MSDPKTPLTDSTLLDLTPKNRKVGAFKDMSIATAMFTLGQYAMQIVRYFWENYVDAEEFFWNLEGDPVFIATVCSVVGYLLVNKRREVVVKKMNGG